MYETPYIYHRVAKQGDTALQSVRLFVCLCLPKLSIELFDLIKFVGQIVQAGEHRQTHRMLLSALSSCFVKAIYIVACQAHPALVK